MSAPFELNIWDFALAWYRQPDVEADCLTAQDHHGLDIPALIFALYRGRKRHGFDPYEAVTLSQAWALRVVSPVRNVRRVLKTSPIVLDQQDTEVLRDKLKAVELDAERIILNALAGLGEEGDVRDEDAAVLAIAKASQAIVTQELSMLLKRLAKAARIV